MENKLTIETAKQFVEDFKTGTTNTTSLWYRTLESDRSVYQWVSESYEVLINAEILDMYVHKVSEAMSEILRDCGLSHKVRNMREAIDPKFINQKYDAYQKEITESDQVGGGNLPLDSSTIDYTKQNSPILEMFERMDVSSNKAQEFLKNNWVDLNLDVKFINMILSVISAIEEKANYLTDDRQKVFRSDQIILQILKEVATRNFCFDALIIEKMKQLKISSKQIGKIIDLDIKDPFPTLRPENEVQATQISLSGAQCDMCNTWRMRYIYNSDAHQYQDLCLDCGCWQNRRLSPTIANR